MKKTARLLLLFAAGTAFAAMPVERTITHVSTPIQLGFDEDHALYPKEYGVHGLRLNCYFVDNRYMHGLDIGFWNASLDASGLQFALYRNESHDFGGIQFAGWSSETKRSSGLQAALVTTDAEDVFGAQLTGLMAKARGVNGFQIGLLTADSESQGDDSRMKGFQAAFFEARAEHVDGVQFGGVFSEARDEANGAQLSLGFAKARRSRGLQMGGLVARSKQSHGVQFGGLMAQSELEAAGVLQAAIILAEAGDMTGHLQLAGVAANTLGASDGAQVGIISTMAGSMNGMQAALAWNYVFEDANGLQLSAFYNHARFVHGVQIGLINHCSQLDGVQIGLINTVKEADFSTCPLLRINF